MNHCKTCRYFDELYDQSHTGLCRRNPPSERRWPEVGRQDWCGEHRLKAYELTEEAATLDRVGEP